MVNQVNTLKKMGSLLDIIDLLAAYGEWIIENAKNEEAGCDIRGLSANSNRPRVADRGGLPAEINFTGVWDGSQHPCDPPLDGGEVGIGQPPHGGDNA